MTTTLPFPFPGADAGAFTGWAGTGIFTDWYGSRPEAACVITC